jgi:3D (Asp-Asp-Asp) domain-containing protein
LCGLVAVGAGYVTPVLVAAAPAHAHRTAPPASTAGALAPRHLTLHHRGAIKAATVLSARVAGALDELGVTLSAEDRLLVLPPSAPPLAGMRALHAEVLDGTEVAVIEVTHEQRRSEAQIPYATREIRDPSLPAGLVHEDRPGALGVRSMVDDVTFEDGREVGRGLLADEVALPPQERVVRLGTGPSPTVARTAQRFSRSIDGSATSYCLTGMTASGVPAGPGSIAVDPAVIPLGSHLYVSGYGFGYAVDTGSVIHGTLVDVWNPCDAALAWGRRPATIYILDS